MSVLASGCWVWFLASVLCPAAAAQPPNMIMLMADDQGWGDVGYNNHTYSRKDTDWKFNAPRTPNLDAMAASDSSLVFWRFYAGSGVCSPTRAAAMTGRSPERECIDGPEPHGYGPADTCFSNMPLSPHTTTIAELAEAAGYETLHVGKWHLVSHPYSLPYRSAAFAFLIV
jgi:arylsulfatase A-like enzyme